MSAGVEPQVAADQAVAVQQPAAPTAPARRGRFLSAATIAKLAIIAILAIWPFLYQDLYTLSWMTFAGLSLMVVVSVYLIIAQAGQLSFGHAAFYGVGAYTASILSIRYNVPTLLALVIGAVLAGLIALVIGRPVLRLRYFYLALATIGLGIIFSVIVIQAAGVTGGTLGLAPVPPLDLFGFKIDTYFRQYYLVWDRPRPAHPAVHGTRPRHARGARPACNRDERDRRRRRSACAPPTGSSSPSSSALSSAPSPARCTPSFCGDHALGVRLQRRHPADHHDARSVAAVHLGRPDRRRADDVIEQPVGTQQWSGVIDAADHDPSSAFLPMGITGLFTKQRLVSLKAPFAGRAVPRPSHAPRRWRARGP